jgi:hypothetical protein
MAKENYWLLNHPVFNKPRKEILAEHYPNDSWTELDALFPERNRQAIRKAASTFGIKKNMKDSWNDEMDALIKQTFQESNNEELIAEDRKRMKFTLITDVNKIASDFNLKSKNWVGILRHAQEFGLMWGVKPVLKEGENTICDKLFDTDDVLAFMIEKRAVKDLEKHFGISMEIIKKKLPKNIGNFELISYRRTGGQRIFFYHEKAVLTGGIQKRIWTPIYPKNDDGEIDDGALVIRFEPSDWREIRVIPFAEAHVGSPFHDAKKFSSNLKLAENIDHFFFINGSIFPKLPKGKMEDKVDFILEIKETVKKLLATVAHKILWAHQGCTEEKIENALGLDPLAEVCRELQIPYFKRPVMAEILWGKVHFSFFCIHGDTHARSHGTMLNAVTNLLDQFEYTDFIVMSHQKSGNENPATRTIRNRTLCRLMRKQQHLVITQGFLKYEGSREEKKGRKLPIAGTCAIILFNDGGSAYSD